MGSDEEKLAIVLECLALDNPRSTKDYVDNLMTWDMDTLVKYRDRRKRQLEALPKSTFRPHP